MVPRCTSTYLVLVATGCSWSAVAAAAKIACVGDSITYGYNLSSPSTQSYPAVLQTLLGSAHTVKNFGSNGRTLLKKGDGPYWNEAEFSASDAFKPDVVIVMLGTNDAKPQNWAYKADFAGDYDDMIDHYRGLGALVYVALPPPVVPPGNFQIDPNVLNDEIVPLTRQIATAADAPTIDVYQAFNGKTNLLADTVHPNAEGANLIAQTVQFALQQGGYGGYVGTGGTSSSTGGSQATGGVKSSGGAQSTGGLAASGGRSMTLSALGGTLSTGGLASSFVSAGGSPAAGGSLHAGGRTTTDPGTAGFGGHQSAGGAHVSTTTLESAQGGLSTSSGGAGMTGSSAGGTSSSGGASSTRGTGVPATAGQVGSVVARTSARNEAGASSSIATAVSQTTSPSGCGCRVQRRNPSLFAVWGLAVLSLSLAWRRRSNHEPSLARVAEL